MDRQIDIWMDGWMECSIVSKFVIERVIVSNLTFITCQDLHNNQLVLSQCAREQTTCYPFRDKLINTLFLHVAILRSSM